MEPASKARALLLGADASLASLLADVLTELGVALEVGRASGPPPDLVLVHAERGEGIPSLLRQTRQRVPFAPIVVLVPFADERLVQRALGLGAGGCFALGRPLDELRHVLREQVPALARSGASPSGGGPPSTWGNDR